MNILYISTSFPKPTESSTIYTDLAEEFVKNDHILTVVVSEEKRKAQDTGIASERGCKVLRIKTGNLYDVGFIEKGLTILQMQNKFKAGIKKYLSDQKFDLILFESPPVTTASVVKWAMAYYNAPSYLMLKDIFPQNAVDIGVLTKSHPAYSYFKFKEKQLYKTATIIGTMSDANRNYIIKHAPYIDEKKIKYFPNTKKVSDKEFSNVDFRAKYDLPKDAVVAVYGGNMGKPQGMDFVCEVLLSNKTNNDVFFVLVGRGTEREKTADFIKRNNIKNALLLNSLPREEYESMLEEADIGLVFLDKRFTIPNFPSRVLSYFEKKIPVLAATDERTDFGEMLEESQSGFYTIAGDVMSFNECLDKLLKSSILRKKMGENGYEKLVVDYNVENSVEMIENHLMEFKK